MPRTRLWVLPRAMWAELRTLPQVDADVMCHQDLAPPELLLEFCGIRFVKVVAFCREEKQWTVITRTGHWFDD